MAGGSQTLGSPCVVIHGLLFRCFWKPCDHDPPTENFKNIEFFEDTLKIHNVYFWGDSVYFWGDNVYFGRNSVYFGGSKGFSKIFGFLGFLFSLLRGFWGSVGRGAPQGFSKISNLCLFMDDLMFLCVPRRLKFITEIIRSNCYNAMLM